MTALDPISVPPTQAIRCPRVLLADDNESLRKALSLLLRRAGYEVVEVGDALEFLDFLSTLDRADDDLDLVVTDVWMPNGSGLEMVANLRQLRWKTPVIVMSASHSSETRAEVEAAGAIMLDKPFVLSRLLAEAQRLAPLPPSHGPRLD